MSYPRSLCAACCVSLSPERARAPLALARIPPDPLRDAPSPPSACTAYRLCRPALTIRSEERCADPQVITRRSLVCHVREAQRKKLVQTRYVQPPVRTFAQRSDRGNRDSEIDRDALIGHAAQCASANLYLSSRQVVV